MVKLAITEKKKAKNIGLDTGLPRPTTGPGARERENKGIQLVVELTSYQKIDGISNTTKG